MEEEREHYLQDYREYLKTVCSLEELSQILPEIESIEYKKQILCLQNRKQNPFVICKIMKQKIQIGFCDYICYADEDGKCLIGNFFVYAEHRNKGYGSAAHIETLKKKGPVPIHRRTFISAFWQGEQD